MAKTSKKPPANEVDCPKPPFRTRAEMDAWLRENAEAMAALPD